MRPGNLLEKHRIAASQNTLERDYWLDRLSGDLTKSGFYNDRTGASGDAGAEQVIDFALSGDMSEQFNKICKDSHYTLNIMMVSLVSLLLNKYTGNKDLLVGTPIYKQETSGDFINTVLVLRNKIESHLSFKELLMQMRQTVKEAVDHQNYPLEMLVERLDPDFSGEGSPFFDVAVLLENIHQEDYLQHFPCGAVFSFVKKGSNISGSLAYDPGLYGESSMKAAINHFEILARAALSNMAGPVGELSLLSKDEKKQLLQGFNQREFDFPEDKTFHRLFSEQVEKNSHAVALRSPLDLSDVFLFLESEERKIKEITKEKIEHCCFKKNPYVYRSPQGLFENEPDLYILKTHKHISLVVDHNMIELIDLFDGGHNVISISRAIGKMTKGAAWGLECRMYEMSRQDLLEVSYRFNDQAQIFTIRDLEGLLALIRALNRNQLIELSGMNSQTTLLKEKITPSFLLEKREKTNPDISQLLQKKKAPSTTQVLLLGDTPGIPTTGVLYLGAYLQRNGVEALCQFYDSGFDYQGMKKNIEELLENHQPKIVAVSLKWFLYIARVLQVCDIVKAFGKERGLDIKVVLGGNTASYYWRELIDRDCVDFIVRGDGEEPLLAITQGQDPAGIPNCVFKKEGQILENPITYAQDESNSSDIYLSHLDRVMLSSYASLPGSFFIYTHKGCVMNCLYCGGCKQAQQDTFNRSKVLRRNTNEVRRDIEAVKTFTSTLQFDFDFPDKNILEYCKQIWEGMDLSSHFCIFATLNPPDEELIALLSNTFKYVYWDLDICTPSQRHRMDLFSRGLVKPQFSDSLILDFMAMCEYFPNIEVRINLITGLPYFEEKDIEPGREFLLRLMKNYSSFGELHWARLHAQPGAPVVENAEAHGMHSYALSFDDFLEYSEKNYKPGSPFVDVANFAYPFIYFQDEGMNSLVTKFYLDLNRQVEQFQNARKRNLIISSHLSYGELDEKSDKLATILRTKGVGPGNIMALMLERSVNIPLVILAVLKAGAAYLPIDPEAPPGRISFMLKDSNALGLLTTRSLTSVTGELGDVAIDIIFLEDMEQDDMDSIPKQTILPGDPVYVIYTSGTTGQPKGVLLNHSNLVNYVTWFSSYTGLTKEDKTLLTSSFAYDLGYTSLYTALSNGCELHILPREIYLLADRLLNYIKKEEITYMKVTPSLFSIIANSPNFSRHTCKTLRLAAIGGEQINLGDLEKSHSRCPHIRLMNHYGPTEATIGCVATWVDFDRFDEYKIHPVIGKPIFNTGTYILNKNLEILPMGIPGELCIAGKGLARGYLNRPELTAERFILNCGQYDLTPGGHRNHTLYRTGDLARYLPDRKIDFLGRIDNQIKLRGYRIELGEIESELLKNEKISEALVLVKEEELCAYVVPVPAHLGQGDAKAYSGNLLTPAEIEKQEEFTPTPHDFSLFLEKELESTMVDRFNRLVQENPNAIALRTGKKTMTYQELNGYANPIAHKIIRDYDDEYGLSRSERTRYKRQMLLHEWGMAGQEKLKSTTVFVAGAGGGASPSVVQLALAGFGTIVICDFDTVELSNLNRQFLHDESRIGMNKALSAKMTIERINPNVRVIPITEKLTRENVFDLVGDAHIIFDMFDGQQDKFVLSECATAKGIPHIISAMVDINSYAVVFHTPFTPCFHCMFDKKKLDEVIAGMSQFQEKYEKNPLPVVATSLFQSTSFAVNEAIKIVLGIGEPAYGKFIYFNQRGGENLVQTDSFRAMTYTFSDHFMDSCKNQGFDWAKGWRGNYLEEPAIEPDPQCPLCGEAGKEYRDELVSRIPGIQESTAPQVEEKEPVEKTGQYPAVAVIMSYDMDMALGILACLKAGKTYVPLHPGLLEREQLIQLTESGTRIILSAPKYLELAEKLKHKVNSNIKVIDMGGFSNGNSPVNPGDEKNPHLSIPNEQPVFSMITPAEKPGKELQSFSLNHKDILSFSRNYTFNLQEKGETMESNLQRYPCKIGAIFLGQLLSGKGAVYLEKPLPEINPGSLADELRACLHRSLPDYMIPTHFIDLEEMPLTANGKVDRKALPEPSRMVKTSYSGPRSGVEKKLVEIWARVLDRKEEEIGIHANFFELGGHSLNATLMTTQVHKELNVNIPMGEVFKMPTIMALAEYMKGTVESELRSIQVVPEQDYYPVSSAQKRMYVLKQLKGEHTTSDSTPGVLLVEGKLDPRAFEKIFWDIIKRHDAFRTSFEIIGDQIVQKIVPARLAAEVLPFEIKYSQAREKDIPSIVKSFIRPFDLSKAPLFRLEMVEVARDRYILLYDMHHIVTDGTSIFIFVRDFIYLCKGVALPELQIQYKDFAAWQNDLFESEAIKKQEEYWLGVFNEPHNIPTLEMPTDFPRPSVEMLEGNFMDFELDIESSNRVRQLAAQGEATLFMVFLSIFNILLAKYSGQEDIIIGVPIQGRLHPDLENVIGFFINTLAMRNFPEGEKTFSQFLEEVKEHALNAYDNQDYQFESLVEKLGIKPDPSRPPLFNAVLQHGNINMPALEVQEGEPVENPVEGVANLSFKAYEFENTIIQFDLLLHLVEQKEKIGFKLLYSTRLFKKETIDEFIRHFLNIAREVAGNAQVRLSEIEMISPSGEESVLEQEQESLDNLAIDFEI